MWSSQLIIFLLWNFYAVDPISRERSKLPFPFRLPGLGKNCAKDEGRYVTKNVKKKKRIFTAHLQVMHIIILMTTKTLIQREIMGCISLGSTVLDQSLDPGPCLPVSCLSTSIRQVGRPTCLAHTQLSCPDPGRFWPAVWFLQVTYFVVPPVNLTQHLANTC